MSSTVPSGRRDQTSLISAIATLVLLVVAGVVGVATLQPPNVVPATAPPTDFSADRAAAHINAIAQVPRAMGEDGHDAAFDYIVAQLEALGLTTETQEGTRVGRIPSFAGLTRNVMGRLDSPTATDGAVLLVAHYDSIADGPGASDNAANVAILLESARVLTQSEPLQRDVIFLMTDGEETGLLGASAFVNEHPWAQEVGLVINLEARGHYGPSLMFETSQNNNWLIQDLAPAMPYPQTSSLFYEVYQMLPNSTDFAVFKETEWAGFNFAFMNGLTHYHTRLDNIANLDLRSVQAQGDNALALTRAAGTVGIPDRAAGNAVYFTLLGSTLFRYTGDLVLPLAVLALIAWGAVVFDGLRRRQTTWRSIGAGFLALLLTLIATFAVVALVWFLIGLIHPAYAESPSGDIYNYGYYAIGFVALTLALSSLIYSFWFRRSGAIGVALGGLLWWLLLTVLTSLVLPGGSFTFLFPLLFGLLGVWLWMRFPALATTWWGGLLFLGVTALPSVLLFAPTISLLFVALTVSQVALIAVIVALCVGWLVLPFHLWHESLGRWLPIGLAVVALIAFLGGSLTAGSSPEHPRPTSLFYVMDGDTNRAEWASANRAMDEWTSQYLPNPTLSTLPDFLPRTSDQYWHGDAPTVAIEAPEITVLERTVSGNSETLRLQIQSNRDAPVLLVSTDANARILSAAVNGESLISSANTLSVGSNPGWGFRYYAPPADGVELVVTIQADAPYMMQVVDLTIGLPATEENLPPMPDDMMPAPYSYANMTLIRKAYTFDPTLP